MHKSAGKTTGPHLSNRIESVQLNSTKFLPNCKYLSYATRLTTLKLQSLEHRRLIADLVMCYNIIHGNNCLNPQTSFILNFSAITRGHPLRISVPLATLNVRQHFYATRVFFRKQIPTNFSSPALLHPGIPSLSKLSPLSPPHSLRKNYSKLATTQLS